MDELSGDEWQVCGRDDGKQPGYRLRRHRREGKNIRENSSHPRLQPYRGFVGAASLIYR